MHATATASASRTVISATPQALGRAGRGNPRGLAAGRLALPPALVPRHPRRARRDRTSPTQPRPVRAVRRAPTRRSSRMCTRCRRVGIARGCGQTSSRGSTRRTPESRHGVRTRGRPPVSARRPSRRASQDAPRGFPAEFRGPSAWKSCPRSCMPHFAPSPRVGISHHRPGAFFLPDLGGSRQAFRRPGDFSRANGASERKRDPFTAHARSL
jgi:hypothetical protein